MIYNINDINLWELGTTISELQNKTWEQIKNGSNSRIRTKNLFPCSSSLKVKISSNYNIDLLWFNEEGLMISEIETNWMQGNNDEFISISVPNDAKQIGILVRFTDNSTISPSEILNTNIYYDDGLLPNNSIIAENIINIIVGETLALKMYFGEELIWKDNKLPSNAVEIEYIESTGTQYIDLLFKPTTNKVTIQTNISITDTSQDSTIIGVVDDDDILLRFYPLGFSNSKFYSCNFSGKWNSAYSLNSSNISSNIFYEVESTIGNTISLTINDNTYTLSRAEGYSGEKSLYLFARNESTIGHFAKCKMKYLKIYESDVLIMDLIPIRIGLIGYMYDKISKQIFENIGTGNFVLGSDKS